MQPTAPNNQQMAQHKANTVYLTRNTHIGHFVWGLKCKGALSTHRCQYKMAMSTDFKFKFNSTTTFLKHTSMHP